jgi:hypothetical protein
MLAHGAMILPGKFSVLHRCDNPPCVNPAHLFIGTPLDNSRDMAAKKRWKNWTNPEHPRRQRPPKRRPAADEEGEAA